MGGRLSESFRGRNRSTGSSVEGEGLLASIRKIAEDLGERFTSAWSLLNSTTKFLEKTPDFAAHENDLRGWRLRLQSGRNNPDALRVVHDELVDLRRHLRAEGYDLSLVDRNLLVQGFRNDSCLAEGFRRLVLVFVKNESVYFMTGDDNHLVIGALLEAALEKGGVYNIADRHYLWYRWNAGTLILSGADTEDRDDFRRFEALAARNPMKLLSRLKGLA